MNPCMKEEPLPGTCMILVHNSTEHDLQIPLFLPIKCYLPKQPPAVPTGILILAFTRAPTPASGSTTMRAYAKLGNQGRGWGRSMLVATMATGQNSGPGCDRHCAPGRLKEGLIAAHPTVPKPAC